MKLLHAEGVVVLPYETVGKAFPHVRRFEFVTPHAHVPRGTRAVLVEDPEASPRSLARAELGFAPDAELPPRDRDLVEHTAAWILGELAWLQDAPTGARVRVAVRGEMKCDVSAEHLDWHRAQARSWAKKQRRDGYLPLLVVRGDRARVVAIPWVGRRTAVDLDLVRERLPQYGVRVADRIEVL